MMRRVLHLQTSRTKIKRPQSPEKGRLRQFSFKAAMKNLKVNFSLSELEFRCKKLL
jgi:hypothetical protein